MLSGGWALIRAPAHRGFRCGPQATDWGTHPLGHFGSVAQAAGPLSGLVLTQGFRCGPLDVRPASGELLGCFSALTVQG